MGTRTVRAGAALVLTAGLAAGCQSEPQRTAYADNPLLQARQPLMQTPGAPGTDGTQIAQTGPRMVVLPPPGLYQQPPAGFAGAKPADQMAVNSPATPTYTAPTPTYKAPPPTYPTYPTTGPATPPAVLTAAATPPPALPTPPNPTSTAPQPTFPTYPTTGPATPPAVLTAAAMPPPAPTPPVPPAPVPLPAAAVNAAPVIGPSMAPPAVIPPPAVVVAPVTQVVVRTAEGKYGHSADYTWLQGELDRHYRGHLELRYRPVSEDDPYGGKVRLEEDPLLLEFRPGDIIAVEGEMLTDPDGAAAAPWAQYKRFHVRAVRLVERK